MQFFLYKLFNQQSNERTTHTITIIDRTQQQLKNELNFTDYKKKEKEIDT